MPNGGWNVLIHGFMGSFKRRDGKEVQRERGELLGVLSGLVVIS